MGVLIPDMSEEEWRKFVADNYIQSVKYYENENLVLKSKIRVLEAANLSNNAKRKEYLPQPRGKFTEGELITPRQWSSAIIERAVEARLLLNSVARIDLGLKASIEKRMFQRDASDFKKWALKVAEIIVLGISWLER